jgi:hypothetical protein
MEGMLSVFALNGAEERAKDNKIYGLGGFARSLPLSEKTWKSDN